MVQIASLLVLLGTLCSSVLALSDQASWIVPSDPGPSNNFGADLVWTIGGIATIQWNSTVDSYDLALYQQGIDPASGVQVKVFKTYDSGGSGVQSLDWQVDNYGADLTFSPVFFFWLNPSLAGATSHYFNLTEPHATVTPASTALATASPSSSTSPTSTESTAAASSSSSAQSSTTTSASAESQPLTTGRSSSLAYSSSSSYSSVSSSSTTSQATSSPTSSATPAASPTNSAADTTVALKVGLGVGLGVGIPLVLVAIAFLVLRILKQRKSSRKSNDDGRPPTSQFGRSHYTEGAPEWRSELPHRDNGVYEAPGGAVRPAELAGSQTPAEMGWKSPVEAYGGEGFPGR